MFADAERCGAAHFLLLRMRWAGCSVALVSWCRVGQASRFRRTPLGSSSSAASRRSAAARPLQRICMCRPSGAGAVPYAESTGEPWLILSALRSTASCGRTSGSTLQPRPRRPLGGRPAELGRTGSWESSRQRSEWGPAASSRSTPARSTTRLSRRACGRSTGRSRSRCKAFRSGRQLPWYREFGRSKGQATATCAQAPR